ncbi:MAG: MoaD/ThiS family protein [Hylemonella sp.]|nr:MoaD/ThiS family protein [Hylemonella sp.]
MKVTLKLFASLTDYLPEHGRADNQMSCEVGADATPAQVIDACNLPPKLVHLVLLNGVYLDPAQRQAQALAEGDVLAIWPPIAGG